MPYEVAAKNLMLEQLRLAITHVSLHSGKPTARNGINARLRVEFSNPSNGVMALKEPARFNVPAGSQVTYAGFWTNSAGGVLLASSELEAVFFSKAGFYVLDAARLDLNLEGRVVAQLH